MFHFSFKSFQFQEADLSHKAVYFTILLWDDYFQDLEGIRLYIGISPTGIRIYQAGDMVRMNSFNWAKVLQVIILFQFKFISSSQPRSREELINLN